VVHWLGGVCIIGGICPKCTGGAEESPWTILEGFVGAGSETNTDAMAG